MMYLFIYVVPLSNSQVHCGSTHQSLELGEADGGAVEQVGGQPSLVLVTVANGRACGAPRGERR